MSLFSLKSLKEVFNQDAFPVSSDCHNAEWDLKTFCLSKDNFSFPQSPDDIYKGFHTIDGDSRCQQTIELRNVSKYNCNDAMLSFGSSTNKFKATRSNFELTRTL